VVFELAERRHGYFTASEAKAAGVPSVELVKMASRGVLERISQGVYRLARFPLSARAQYVEAVLWPQRGGIGVLSHESALALHQLSDVNPSMVHITIPRTHRIRRAVPRYLVVHQGVLGPEEWETIDAIPVTTPARTIRDCHATGLGPALIRQAIEEGGASGQLTRDEASALRRELLGEPREQPGDERNVKGDRT
jgi:predicted transcriptional regulator of viral defense system